MSDGVKKMGFVRTTALMIMGYIAMKALQRAVKNIEASQVKARVNEPKAHEKMKRLRLDPVTGAYIPEA
jgi:hypothetical protein